jgi:hypothetical protein
MCPEPAARMERGRGSGEPRTGSPPEGLGLPQVDRGGLALVAALELEAHALALMEMPEARPLDGRDMHEHVLRAVLRLDEAIAFLGIEPLHGSDRHCRPSSHRKLPPLEMERRSRTTTLNGEQVRRSMRVEEQAERCRSRQPRILERGRGLQDPTGAGGAGLAARTAGRDRPCSA